MFGEDVLKVAKTISCLKLCYQFNLLQSKGKRLDQKFFYDERNGR